MDLFQVSFIPNNYIEKFAADDSQYYKTPFLYLISSYVKNESIRWAHTNLNYVEYTKKGDWVVYKFKKQ